jgi:sec-independent protein translocase protein TatA
MGVTCRLSGDGGPKRGDAFPLKGTEMNIGDLFDSPLKVLIIAVVVLVLFGTKKMPDAARSLGRSMRILKSEVSNLHDDHEEQQQAQIQPQPLPAVSQQAQIDALQQQIRDLQQQPQPVSETAGVNGTQATEVPRTQQAG